MVEEQYAVLRQDIARGWVCFTAGDPSPPPERVGEFLNIDFVRWLRQNSTFKDPSYVAHRRQRQHGGDPRVVRLNSLEGGRHDRAARTNRRLADHRRRGSG
jgi:hypothetical protein